MKHDEAMAEVGRIAQEMGWRLVIASDGVHAWSTHVWGDGTPVLGARRVDFSAGADAISEQVSWAIRGGWGRDAWIIPGLTEPGSKEAPGTQAAALMEAAVSLTESSATMKVLGVRLRPRGAKMTRDYCPGCGARVTPPLLCDDCAAKEAPADATDAPAAEDAPAQRADCSHEAAGRGTVCPLCGHVLCTDGRWRDPRTVARA